MTESSAMWGMVEELHEMSRHASDDADALERMLRRAVAAFGAVSGCLAVIDEEQPGRLMVMAGIDVPAGVVGSHILLGQGVLGGVAASGAPRLLNGERRDAEAGHQRRQGTPSSAICWPLTIKGRLIGALSMNRVAGAPPFGPDDVERGRTMVTLLALLVDNARMAASQQRRIAHLSQLNEQLEAAQAQLLQSEKMASIGQLAAGVAHEINNPVGYVTSNLGTLGGYVEELLAAVASLRDGKPVPEHTDLAYLADDIPDLMAETREGLERVKKIVQDLKDFSRVDTSDEVEWADLLAGLESTLNIVHNEIKYKATVVRELQPLPDVPCRPSQINQVFMNLLVNAAQAIPERGSITLRSGHDEDQVWIEVGDDGCGMTEQVCRRIFEPFFTTKPVGKGTGLGLSLSYSIVRKHGGRIDVQSRPGSGTTFRVSLPRRIPSGAAQDPAVAHV